MTGLCPTCAYVRVIESATGSRFLMCRLAKEDPHFMKYPPQPVIRCAGYEAQPIPKEPEE